MKVLIDECLDWRLARDMPGHQVKTVQEMGWSGISNGRLLALAQSQFDALLTGDQNLPSQQNLARFSIAIIVLKADSTRLLDLRPLMSEVRAILPANKPGQLVRVGAG